MFTVKYFASWWGLEALGVEAMLERIKGTGYDGIEIGIPKEQARRAELRALLEKYDLQVIAHEYQAEGREFEHYLRSYMECIDIAASFRPVLVNSHTGRDYWTLEQNLRLVDAAQEAAERHGVPILHETHRGRFLYSAPVAADYFRLRPDLRITADFGHWVCVAESLLVGHDAVLDEAIARTGHIHARIGSAEAPQVPDPFSQHWRLELNAYSSWWMRIAKRLQSAGHRFLTVTLESGPPPYGWISLETGRPVRDFIDTNRQMKDYLTRYFHANLLPNS